MKIAIVSLGCPKNQVDADVYCRALIEDGHETVPSIDLADIVLINTCGFIQSAKEEAIENILDACRLKEERPNVKVIVTGCLAERYKEEIGKEIPEVDAVVGIGKNAQLPEIVRELCAPQNSGQLLEEFGAKAALPLGSPRVIGTPRHYAWLKISEGCSNACSYCAIPSIRGPLRSRSLEDCVEEAKWLAQQGVKEVVLVAQDVTAFGDDKGQNQIAELLDELNKIEELHWIRMLYAYPERITPELLDAVARNPKVVRYFDIPIQHINDEILASMRRKGNGDTVRNAIAMIREKLPDAVLRTTLIAGYPGETQEQFDELCEFVQKTEFDRLGCFAYSPEEGTLAEKLPGQLPEEVKSQRAEAIMEIQARVSARKQEAKIGLQLEVICDGVDAEEGFWICRSYADAPEIDADILVSSEQALEVGEFYKVQVTQADVYDLYAEIIK